MEWGVGGPVLEHGPSDSGERGGWRGGRRGHRSRQEQKLRAQRVSEQEAQDQQEELLGNNGERSKIFDGVAAYFEGYTDKYGDYELKRMLVAHGGYVCQAMRVTRTTHLVCSNLAAAKVNAMIGRFGTRFSVLVVRPSWIARSVAAGRRLAEGPFAVLPAELIAGGPSIAKVFKPLEDPDGGNRKADGEKRSFGKKQRQAFTPVPSPTDSDENVARKSKGATPTIGKRRSSRATRSKKDLRAAIAQLSKRAYHRKVGLCATVGVGQELCIRRDGSRGAK